MGDIGTEVGDTEMDWHRDGDIGMVVGGTGVGWHSNGGHQHRDGGCWHGGG